MLNGHRHASTPESKMKDEHRAVTFDPKPTQKEPSRHIQVEVPEKEYREIKELAASRGMSIKALCLEAIRFAINSMLGRPNK